jgi:hypothetical protein
MDKYFKYFLVALLPCIFYYGFYFKYGINAPFADDWSVIVGLVIHFFHSQESWLDKFLLLFAQCNEHRELFLSIITVAQFAILGHINFFYLNLIGGLSSLGILIVLYKILKRYRHPEWLIIPISFTLFNLAYFHNLYWPVSALQHNVVVFLIVSTLCVLDYSQGGIKSFLLANFIAFVALFSSGNGFIVYIAAAPLIFRYLKLYRILWFLSGAFFFFLYINNYEHPVQRGNLLSNIFLFKGILGNFFAYWGAFASSFFESGSVWMEPVCIAIGALVFFTFIYKFWINRKDFFQDQKDYSFKLSLFVFLLCTVGIYSMARANMPISNVFESRYAINTTLILLLYILFFDNLIYRKFKVVIIGFIVSFFFFSYVNHLIDLVNFTNMTSGSAIKHSIQKREHYFFLDSANKKIDLSAPTLKNLSQLGKPIVNFTAILPSSVKYVNDAIHLTFSHQIYALDPDLAEISRVIQQNKYDTLQSANKFNLGEFEFDINSEHFSYRGLKVKGRILHGSDGYYLVFENAQHLNWIFNMYWREIDRRKQFTHLDGIYLRNLSGTVPFIYLPDDRYVAKIFKIEDGVASLVGVTPNFKVNGM